MDEDPLPKGSSRFKPGQSGNRKGRPRKSTAQPESAFDELRNRKIVVQMDGIERELPLAEALLHKTLQQALAGVRMAIRTVLKRIKDQADAFSQLLLHGALWSEPEDNGAPIIVDPETPYRDKGGLFDDLAGWD